jgi:hypothetical protein
MKRLIFGILTVVVVAATATQVFALGSDFSKDQIAAAGKHCVHGFWVNQQTVMFYAGDTAQLNRDLAKLLDGQFAARKVVIHSGTSKARSPWDTKDRDIGVDWSVNTWDDPADAAKAVPRMLMHIDIWLGSKIKLDELRIPRGFEVVAGPEIDNFIKKRQK